MERIYTYNNYNLIDRLDIMLKEIGFIISV
jgi:hypothetical protein